MDRVAGVVAAVVAFKREIVTAPGAHLDERPHSSQGEANAATSADAVPRGTLPRARTEGGSGRLEGQDHRSMRVIFEPSRVRLYMSPLASKMKPTMGLAIRVVSIEPPAPTVTIATEASTPAFHPCVRL